MTGTIDPPKVSPGVAQAAASTRTEAEARLAIIRERAASSTTPYFDAGEFRLVFSALDAAEARVRMLETQLCNCPLPYRHGDGIHEESCPAATGEDTLTTHKTLIARVKVLEAALRPLLEWAEMFGISDLRAARKALGGGWRTRMERAP